MNVSTVLAEGPTPPPVTEEPTQEPTAEIPLQPELAASETPTVEETSSSGDPAPAVEDASASGPFAQLPENTDIIVLDENGNPLPLVSSESLNVILEEDPKWCPEGDLPDSANCTDNLTITQLLDLMELNDGGKFNTNGVIYFERGSNFSYTSSFTLDDSGDSLGLSYNTIKNYNITLRGGWNPSNNQLNSNDPTIFDNNNNVVVRVGSQTNPWVGNVTIRDITVKDNDGNPGPVNGPSLSVYTTSGDITLNNADVDNQADGQYTALLDSSAGDILVTNRSTFDGSGLNQGFSATTDSGSITISGSGGGGNQIAFTDAQGSGTGTNYNGATLSAPTITLSYVTASGNDLNGIYISNASSVTLDHVTSGGNTLGNGTFFSGANNSVGSGVYVQGISGGTTVTVNAGFYANDQRYGIEITNGTLNYQTLPTFGNPQNKNLYGNVSVNTAPVLNLPANITKEATSPSGATVTFTFSATDVEDNPDPTATCNQISGNIFPLGVTTVNCTVTDSMQVTTTGSFTITVQDTTPPTIASHLDVTAEATSANGAIVNYTIPTTSDIVDGSGIATCTPISGSTFPLGSSTVTCNAKDAHNNSATLTTFTVSVLDTTPPTLNLPGNMTVEATSGLGTTVIYSASASDLVDTSVAFSCQPASGSNFPFGITTVNCSAIDDYSNIRTGSFTITVQDMTGPALTLPANIVTEATSPTGAIVTYSASALDAFDGVRPVSCLPASGSTFPLGMTTVNCSSTDAHSNTTNGSFTVTIQDKTAPVIAFHADITVEATSSAGTAITYTNPTANDLVDGTKTATCTPASGTTFALGDTTVTCNITDTYGNIATPTTFTVSVRDTTPPVIAPHSDISSSNPVVIYTLPATTDAVDGAGTASCTPASGSIFKSGNTLVTCTATDSHGNVATPVTFKVHISSQQTGPVTTSGLIPVTGGEPINLDCNTKVVINGVKVIFYNLCNQKAVLNSVDANHLPGKLPAGFTFVSGLDVTVVGQAVLPANTGIEMDFPTGNSGQFAVLYWNNGQWVEITQSLNEADLGKALGKDAANELYRLISSESGVSKALTTKNTGIFILVKK